MEQYNYRSGTIGQIGIILHLAGCLPGGFLACFQFVPVIRHKVILFHRINGHLCILLLTIGNVGAYMIQCRSMGGQPVLQVVIGMLATSIITALLLAYINIKRLQIDLHRMWMIRAWSWAASIITLRLVMMASWHIMRTYGYTYHVAISCKEIFYAYSVVGFWAPHHNPTAKLYPACAGPDGNITSAATSDTYVSVSTSGAGPENNSACMRATFAMSFTVAIIIHAVLVEFYLWLTPAEHYRLRLVSHEKQVEKGLRAPKDPKGAGTESTRLGDAPEWWSLPPAETQHG